MNGAIDGIAGLFIEPEGRNDLAHPEFGSILSFFIKSGPTDAKFLKLIFGVGGGGGGVLVAKNGEEDGVAGSGNRSGGGGCALFGDDGDPVGFHFARVAMGAL